MNNDYPKMLYKTGGSEEIHGGKFATKIVNDEAEQDAALADGWHLNTDEARTVQTKSPKVEDAPTRDDLDKALSCLPGDHADPEYVVNSMRSFFGALFTDADEARVRELVKAPVGGDGKADTAPPTRAEMEQKATELGIKFKDSTSDKKLGELIADALKG